jgi:hypothetical protein
VAGLCEWTGQEKHLFGDRRATRVVASDEIEFLTSPMLPRPLLDLVVFAQQRPGYPSGGPAVAAEWAAAAGRHRAEAALCQLIQVLACPPEIVWGFDVGFECDEPYGFVEFFGGWQSALASALGVPELPVPSRGEWSARWEPHRRRLEAVGQQRHAEPAAAADPAS